MHFSISQSVHLYDVTENQFIVLIWLKPDFQNVCIHVSLTEIELNQISQSQANTPRLNDWK